MLNNNICGIIILGHKNDNGRINTDDYLSDIEEIIKVSNGFSNYYNRMLNSGIGTIYGWLGMIVNINLWRKFIKNPTSFFPEKKLCAECSTYY